MRANVVAAPSSVVPIRHHQGARFLAALFDHALRGEALTLAAFTARWQGRKEGTGPDRTALRRVIQAVMQALAEAGSQTKLLVLPRQRTVGPWHLELAPDERWQIVDAPASGPAHGRAPSLVREPAPALTLAALSVLAVADDLARQGHYLDASGFLFDNERTLALSAEGTALAALRRSRWLRLGGSLADARAVLDGASAAAALAHPAARPQLLADCALQQAQLSYEMDPAAASLRLHFGRMSEQVATSTSARMQLESANLRALASRHKLQIQRTRALGAISPGAQELLRVAGDCFAAALFWAAVASEALHLRMVLANYAYHLQWLVHDNLPGEHGATLDCVIDAWRLSQTVTERFDLPEDSAWNYIMLADLWLQHPKARYLLQTDARLWPRERSPAHLDFYQRALDLARDTGNARLRVLALDRCSAFFRTTGNARQAADYKQRRDRLLQGLTAEYPDLRRELLA